MYETVTAEFVGSTSVVRALHAGMVHDEVRRVTIDRLRSVQADESGSTPSSPSSDRVLRLADMVLEVDTEEGPRHERLHGVVLVNWRRDPASGRLTGRLVAQRIVPRPAPELADEPDVVTDVVTGLSEQPLEPPAPVVEGSPLESPSDDPSSDDSLLPDEPAASALVEHPEATPEPVPEHREPLRLYGPDEAIAPTVGSTVYSPVSVLDGIGVGRDLARGLGSAAFVVRCAATGEPLAGTACVRDAEGMVVVGGEPPMAFGPAGFTLLAPPGRYLVEPQIPG